MEITIRSKDRHRAIITNLLQFFLIVIMIILKVDIIAL